MLKTILLNYVIIVLSFANYVINTLGFTKFVFYLDFYNFFCCKKNLNVEFCHEKRNGQWIWAEMFLLLVQVKNLNSRDVGVDYVLPPEQSLGLSLDSDVNFWCGFG
jgi:hypothetical protein